jgi:hypothetical protein
MISTSTRLLLVVGALLVAVGEDVAAREALAFVVSFDINEELWKATEWTEPPQFALWLENDSTGAVRTLFVTRRTASDDWEGQSSVPASLPYWVTRYQREFGRQSGPTSQDPLPDAVTGATPKLTFSHAFEVEEGDWSLFLEVNVSGDYNEHYQRVVTDGALADFGAGQPSLVYRARDIVRADGPTPLEIIGQTTLAEAPEVMLVEPHHITSAHRLIQNIAFTTRRGED